MDKTRLKRLRKAIAKEQDPHVKAKLIYDLLKPRRPKHHRMPDGKLVEC